MLAENCVKGLKVTKTMHGMKLEGLWGKSETIINKIFETNSSFHVKYRKRKTGKS